MTREDKLIMEPPYLNNQEILGLLLICFEMQLVATPAMGKGTVSLYIRRADCVTGFDFWICQEFTEHKENYKGAVFGVDHEIFVSEGQREDQQSNSLDSWNCDFSIPIVSAYRYLESINYFTRIRPEQENHSLVSEGDWCEIYRKSYED